MNNIANCNCNTNHSKHDIIMRLRHLRLITVLRLTINPETGTPIVGGKTDRAWYRRGEILV